MNALVAAFGDTFSDVLEPEQLVDVHYGIEYPMQIGEYPYCLIDFEESAISNSTVSDRVVLDENNLPYRHWTFDGSVTFSLFSLSAAERDIMIDGFLQVVALEQELTDRLRDETINPFIAIELNTEQVEALGATMSPGTPWGTEEMVYTANFALEATGEFYTTADTSPDMIALVDIYPINEDVSDTATMVVDEQVTLSGTTPVELAHPQVMVIHSDTVTSLDGLTEFERDVDYSMDYDYGLIVRISDGDIGNGETVLVTYSYGEQALPNEDEGGWV